MKNKKPYLSVIVPIYNEEKRIHNLFKIISYLKKQKFSTELILIDDGGTDSTLRLLHSFSKKFQFKILQNEENRGKGFAVKKGMLQASGLYRLFIDIDLSTPIETIDKVIPLFEKHDVIVGSRRIKGSKIIVHQSLLRETMGRVFTKLSQIVLGVTVSDFTCGFKCFSEKAAVEIFKRATIDRWGFDPEILFIAQKLGYKIVEVPVMWKNDSQTRVRFPQDVFNSFLDLLRIRFVNRIS